SRRHVPSLPTRRSSDLPRARRACRRWRVTVAGHGNAFRPIQPSASRGVPGVRRLIVLFLFVAAVAAAAAWLADRSGALTITWLRSEEHTSELQSREKRV